MDNDRLNDSCWNSEMREVELWENEGYLLDYCFSFNNFLFFIQFSQAQIAAQIHPFLRLCSSFFIPHLVFLFLAAPQNRWSKQNLSEKCGLEEGMNGILLLATSQSDVGGANTSGKGSGMIEGNGEIRFVPCL